MGSSLDQGSTVLRCQQVLATHLRWSNTGGGSKLAAFQVGRQHFPGAEQRVESVTAGASARLLCQQCLAAACLGGNDCQFSWAESADDSVELVHVRVNFRARVLVQL